MIRDDYPGFRSRVRILIFYPSRITDPGFKKAPDPGSGSATLHAQIQERKSVGFSSLEILRI